MIHSNPFDDFDEYVNGEWMSKTKIPDDQSDWGTFNIIYEKNINKINKLLQKLALDSNNKRHIIGKMYERLITSLTTSLTIINNEDINELKKLLTKIDEIKTLKDMGNRLGYLAKIDINPFFDISASEDPMDTQMVRFAMWSPKLSMPEKGYYIDPKLNQYVIEFKKNVGKTFKFIYNEWPDQECEKCAEDIFTVETFIAHALKSIEAQRNIEEMYHKTNMELFFESLTDACNKIPETHKGKDSDDTISFWSNYFGTAKLNNINDFIVYDISYFRKITIMLNMFPLEKLKTYVKYVVIKSTEKTLISGLDDILFDFYDKKLNGQTNPASRDKLVIELLSKIVGDMVGKEYVNEYFHENTRKMVSEMIQNVKQQMFLSIENSDWMSRRTKDNAILKLNKFRVKIGHPDVWKNHDKLLLILNHMFGNISMYKLINLIKRYNYGIYLLDMINKQQDPDKWSMHPHEINAYYNPQRNEIVFPAGILVEPFFSKNQSLGKNYGGIGMIIGHEITHGYDDQGRKYDQNGNLSNQWDTSDVAKYEMLSKKMIDQYDKYSINNHHVNGKLTLGENIADLGGVVLSFRALCEKLTSLTDESKIEQKKDFFINYANVWKNITKPEKILSQLLSNPHSPGKFRIWVVRNVDDFYQTFKEYNVDNESTNSMYLSPSNRIEIW